AVKRVSAYPYPLVLVANGSLKELSDGASLVDARDGAGEQLRGRKRGDERQLLLVGQTHRVGEDHRAQMRGAQARDCGSREYTMHRAGVHVARALLFHQANGLKEGAGSIDLVVHDDGCAAGDLADEAKALHTPVVAQAALLDNGQWGVEALGEVARLL